jgi:hypothetical protein
MDDPAYFGGVVPHHEIGRTRISPSDDHSRAGEASIKVEITRLIN